MPRISLPPTPVASTEIQGKDCFTMSAADKTFNLGPPAIAPKIANGHLTSTKQTDSIVAANITLPPPPTRSRTIIQMKPKPQPATNGGKVHTQRNVKGINRSGGVESVLGNGTGKKHPSSTSMAGKKIARKTAHSVIERRRRSKMNEEFATLKGMVPACANQEMHKLAILQASIDYLQYLEKCITDLKVANNSLSTPLIQPQAPPPAPPSAFMVDEDDPGEEDEDEDDDEDVTMRDTPSDVTNLSLSKEGGEESSYRSPESITLSPRLGSQPHHCTSSYASSVSTVLSPTCGPQKQKDRGCQSQSSHSNSTSPVIMPSLEQDQEATVALLMLNQDRRHSKGGRGMSVKDLLSP